MEEQARHSSLKAEYQTNGFACDKELKNECKNKKRYLDVYKFYRYI